MIQKPKLNALIRLLAIGSKSINLGQIITSMVVAEWWSKCYPLIRHIHMVWMSSDQSQNHQGTKIITCRLRMPQTTQLREDWQKEESERLTMKSMGVRWVCLGGRVRMVEVSQISDSVAYEWKEKEKKECGWVGRKKRWGTHKVQNEWKKIKRHEREWVIITLIVLQEKVTNDLGKWKEVETQWRFMGIVEFAT